MLNIILFGPRLLTVFLKEPECIIESLFACFSEDLWMWGEEGIGRPVKVPHGTLYTRVHQMDVHVVGR